MQQIPEYTDRNPFDPEEIIRHQTAIATDPQFANSEEGHILQKANTVEEANYGYLQISAALSREREGVNRSGNNANLNIGRISGENDTIICTSNSQIDKTFLIRAIREGSAQYPLPYQTFEISKEDFIRWTEKSQALASWNNQLFALTSSTGHILKKRGKLEDRDKNYIQERIQEISRLMGYLKTDNFSLFGNCAEEIKKHLQFMDQTYREIEKSLFNNHWESLIVNLEKYSRALAWIIFLIDETLVVGPNQTSRRKSFIYKLVSSSPQLT